MGAWNTPEHLHVALNHLPLIGTAAALIPLLIGLVFKQRPVLLTGIGMVVVFTASTALVMNTGEKAYERFEGGPIKGMLDPDGDVWMHVHEDQAHLVAKPAYGVAAVGAVAFVLVLLRPGAQRLAGVVMLLLAAGVVAAMVWVADSGGKIRHPEFRSGPPPTLEAEYEADHEYE